MNDHVYFELFFPRPLFLSERIEEHKTSYLSLCLGGDVYINLQHVINSLSL